MCFGVAKIRSMLHRNNVCIWKKATTINALEMWYNDKSVPMENRQFSKNKNSVEVDFKRMHKCASKRTQ